MKHSTKTKLMVFITGILSCMLLVSFAACKISEESDETNDYFKEYNMYLVYAASEDITPLDYETWLATVKGEKGDKGDKGEDGKDGANGKSAYEIWLENGHTGSQTDFLEWLKGEKGDKGEAGKDGQNGKDGAEGKSAYQLFKEYYPDYKGTEKEWVTDIAKGEICALFGHSESDWIIDKQPTGTYQGSKHKECTVCKKVLETAEIPSIGYSEGLIYEMNSDNKTCTVTGVEDTTMEEILVPSKSPNGYTVTTIGNSAFKNCTASSIIIQNGIKTIGNRAFYGCANITEIHIPSSVTQIGTQIFYKANNLTTVHYDSSYSSEDNRFLSVSNIKKVVFGGRYVPSVIAGYTNITEVVISDSVTTIGNYAFENCSGLTSITIGNSVTTIGEWAFSGCSGLENIYYAGNIESWCKISRLGNLMIYASSNKKLYINNELITDYLIIPDSVTSIGEWAFSGCSGLTSVTIPDSVTSIGNYAFV